MIRTHKFIRPCLCKKKNNCYHCTFSIELKLCGCIILNSKNGITESVNINYMKIGRNIPLFIPLYASWIFKFPSFEQYTIFLVITRTCQMNDSIYRIILRNNKETHYFAWKIISRPHSTALHSSRYFLSTGVKTYLNPIVPLSIWLIIGMTLKIYSVTHILKMNRKIIHIVEEGFFIPFWLLYPFQKNWIQLDFVLQIFFPQPFWNTQSIIIECYMKWGRVG